MNGRETEKEELMLSARVLHEGEEPKDPGNFILIEEIEAPRGASRYRVTARGIDDEGPITFDETCDSLEIAREWAMELAQTWRSHPPICVRHPLGDDEIEPGDA